MTEFSSGVRKPVSLETIAGRMDRILIEYESKMNASAYDDQVEASSSASAWVPYTTQRGLENQPDILEFAAQGAKDSPDINRNHRTSERPNSGRRRPKPMHRPNQANCKPASSRLKINKNWQPDLPTDRADSDIENEMASYARVCLKDRSRKSSSNRHNLQQMQQN